MNDPLDNRRREGKLTVGRLVEHGPANYQFRASESSSYFVRLVNLKGEQVLWGKDLERAIKEAQTQPKVGDQIGARRIGREVVTVTDRRRDAEGRIISQSEKRASRSQWVVEKVKFFADRQRLARRLRDSQLEARETVREHPELKSTFLSIQAAQAFAAQNIKNPLDRDRFMTQLRAVMAASIQKGEPLPEVRMRDRAATPEHVPAPRPPVRDEPSR
jgi:predicted phage tail protein